MVEPRNLNGRPESQVAEVWFDEKGSCLAVKSTPSMLMLAAIN
jgi:hypothetical protein